MLTNVASFESNILLDFTVLIIAIFKKGMIILKKCLVIVLILALLITSTSFVLAENKSIFPDLSVSHWAYDNVCQLVELRIIEGYRDGRFGPSDQVRVDEFIKMTVTSLGYFPDESKTGYWATNYINKAIDLGLIAENQFNNYQRAIKREEMAYIIVKGYTLNNAISQDNLKPSIQEYIKDYYLIDDSYKDSILTSYQVGLITGKGKNGSDGFDPKGYATRAEASTVIIRLLFEDKREPFSFGDLPYTYIASGDYDDNGDWVETDLKIYAPTNNKGIAVEEVLALHDKIKDIEKRDYGWFRIGYNRYEQTICTLFYPDVETTKLPTFEKVPHLDMAFDIDLLDFDEGKYPYSLVVWRHPEHYSDMATYYNYIEDRYGDFTQIYAEILFEDEASNFLSIYERMTNNIKTGIVHDETYVINDREVRITTNNGITVFVSDKLN